MNYMEIKLLNDLARVPTKASEGAAGFDIYCAESDDVFITPGDTVKVSTGIATAIPQGYFGAVFPRSGLATKQGLRLANCVAVIDSDYRGEWLIPLHNDSDTTRVIEPGDRIAQVVFIECPPFQFEVVRDLDETERGDGGFGHSGVK